MSVAEDDGTKLGTRANLFLISVLLLFLELACIRWFPAHVLYLTFFTNTVLLACFLGMSIGCLAAGRTRRLLVDTPVLLLGGMVLAQLVGVMRHALDAFVQVGNTESPQMVYFGSEAAPGDPTAFSVPIEVVEGVFFVIIALIMVGPGQELGRALNRVPNRLAAYSLNIAGSLVGIALFGACSWLELTPIWWFALIAVGLIYFLHNTTETARRQRWDVLPAAASLIAIASWTSGVFLGADSPVEQLWSPYYRVDYLKPPERAMSVNLIGFQQMVSRNNDNRPAHAYALPHLLQRDSGGQPFENVLVVGAGSGNDVSRALAFGAEHVDAVEIDPAVLRLGQRDHPDRPYDDPRVTTHIADGRNFLRVSEGEYDLVVYALVDSLVLHSGYSNLRLESFAFTREAFEDVRRNLAPDGVFVVYNLFRQGWIVSRLTQSLRETFGTEPLVLTLPYLDRIGPDTTGGFTVLIAGDTERIRDAFEQQPDYWLPKSRALSPEMPSGFSGDVGAPEPADAIRFGLAEVEGPPDLSVATDDWPFLYLRQPMMPALSLRGIGIMGGIAVVLLTIFGRTKGSGLGWRLDGRMFFLGAGFMLVETKAVVHMALLFGSTWAVNSIVFAGVLVMILCANLYVWRRRPTNLAPYYAGLLTALALNLVIPLDSFLGLSRPIQILGSGLLVFAPILFAGVIFAVAFSRSPAPNRDFGANVAGAMFGGLAENTSMLLGFQYLTVVILIFYVASSVLGRRLQLEPAADS